MTEIRIEYFLIRNEWYFSFDFNIEFWLKFILFNCYILIFINFIFSYRLFKNIGLKR